MESFPGTGVRKQMENAYRARLIAPAVSRSRIVVTVSEFSKRQILSRFPKAAVEVIPNTIAEAWFVRNNKVPFSGQDNYLLIMTATPLHKNLGRALQAYAEYVSHTGKDAARLRVVGVSGAAPEYAKRASALGLGSLITFEPFLTESELRNLYRCAKAVVFPSLMEGFGIPVLEGMASGTPVIASNTTSIPEVGGDAALYFDPTDIKDMTRAMIRVLHDPALHTSMIARGFVQSECYHPTKVRQQVENFWDSIPGRIATWK